RPGGTGKGEQHSAPSVGHDPVQRVLLGEPAGPGGKSGRAPARHDVDLTRAEAEHRRNAGELRCAGEAEKTIALERGIVREDDPAAPEPRPRRDDLPAARLE